MWVTLCANWQGFKLKMTTKTLIGWFCMGKQHVLTYIPKYLIVGLAQTVYGIFIYRSYAVYDRIYTV
jgi:hypothetical protein